MARKIRFPLKMKNGAEVRTLDELKECESKNPYGVRVEDSEKHLKKLIKHAKTPMERKMYEKKLNALYKKRKRKI